MKVEDIKKYEGKNVLLILRNGFKYTLRLPEPITETFDFIDKFGKQITLDVDLIELVMEKGELQ